SAGPRAGLRREIGEGLRYVLSHRLLRPIAFCTGTLNLFSSMTAAVVTLFMVRSLGMSAGLIGLTLMLGNTGFLAGALLSSRVNARFGVGHTIVGSIGACGIGALLIPLATRAV